MVGGRTMAGAIDVRCGIVVCLSRLPALVQELCLLSIRVYIGTL